MEPTTSGEGAPTHVDRYVDVKVAAHMLSLSPHYLNRLRVSGGGPAYSTFGRAVRYRIGDLYAWAASKTTTSTSDRAA
ncbi:helix-turn-helix transcriptional regulator [Phenylobacterium sp.]|uniref:helix-turn-helix transcriptional regulator n=1 Tax=Phenylobacterium sp. TaxID=1871053 RepID=UPI0035B24D1E